MKAWYEPDGVYGRRYEIFHDVDGETIAIQEVNGGCEHIGPRVEAKINPERRDTKYGEGVLSALRRKSDALVAAEPERETE